MSQLDYLWTHFGEYTVSTGIQSSPDPNSLVTEKVLSDFLSISTNGAITDLKLVERNGKLDLEGISESGATVSVVSFDKENHLVGISIKKSNQQDVNDGVCEEVDSPLLVLNMLDGTTFKVNLEEFNLQGGETNSIKTNVHNNRIYANLKIDKSIETPVVEVKTTSEGLKVDLTLAESDNQLRLVKTQNGLDTEFKWDDGNNILFKCLTYDQYHSLSEIVLGKIYFITDAQCIYLNGNRYGTSITPSDTISVTNNGGIIKLDVKIDPDEFNLLSKSDKGLKANLFWDNE